jgi:ethanolamine ammonia-lyase small subunit
VLVVIDVFRADRVNLSRKYDYPVSNIRPEGLPCAEAAHKLAWLIAAARQLGATGVRLKDETDCLPPGPKEFI